MDTIKYIKKILFNFILLFLVMFIIQESVYAETNCDKYACAKCVYQSSYGTYTYDIKATGNGDLKVTFSDKNSPNTTTINNISNSYFINSTSNKIECYPIYLSIYASGRSIKATLSSLSSSQSSQLSATTTSTNNNKNITEEKTKHISCDYSDNLSTCTITATENGFSSYSCTNGYSLSNNELDISDFGYGTSCPKASLTCSNRGGNYCTLQKPGSIGSNNTQQGTESQTGNQTQIKNEYTCPYKGQINGQTLTITKKSNSSYQWKVDYPDGNTKEFASFSSNSFPTNECEDIFLVKNNDNVKIVKIDADTIHTDSRISQLCNGYGNEVEQFCHNGNCKISNALCGTGIISDEDAEDGEGCPWQLRAVIVFLKKVAFNTVQLFVPIILIIMGTIDFVKAVSSSDDKGNKDAISKFIKRCLAALMVFFIGTIVSIVMNMFAKTDVGEKNDWKTCWQSIK